MLKKAAIISILCLLALAVTAGILLRAKPQPAPPPTTWLDKLATLGAEDIRLVLRDGFSASISRASIPDVWMLEWTHASHTARWPVQGSHVRGVSTLLSQLRTLPPETSQPGAAGATLTLMVAGKPREIRFESAELGGRVACHVALDEGQTRTVRADASLAKLFTREGLLAWRQSAAFALDSQDVSSIRVETMMQRMMLSRSRAGWTILEPVACAGEAPVCFGFVNQLKALRWEAAPENVSKELAGLASPTTFVRVVSDLRRADASGSVTRETLTQELRIGTFADSSRERAFAEIVVYEGTAEGVKTPAWGPMLATIRLSDIESLPLSWNLLASQRSMNAPLADVGLIILRSESTPLLPENSLPNATPGPRDIALTRTLEGWQRRQGTGLEAPLSPENLEHVNALLMWLSDTPCTEITVAPPKGLSPPVRVDLFQSTSEPIQSLFIARVPPDESHPTVRLAVCSGRIYRLYDSPTNQLLYVWLSEQIPPEG